MIWCMVNGTTKHQNTNGTMFFFVIAKCRVVFSRAYAQYSILGSFSKPYDKSVRQMVSWTLART